MNYLDSAPEEYQDQLYRLYLEWNKSYPRETFQAKKIIPEMKTAFSNSCSSTPFERSLSASLGNLKLELIIDKTAEEWMQFYPLLTINLPHDEARFLNKELLFGKANWNFPAEFLDSIATSSSTTMSMYHWRSCTNMDLKWTSANMNSQSCLSHRH